MFGFIVELVVMGLLFGGVVFCIRGLCIVTERLNYVQNCIVSLIEDIEDHTHRKHECCGGCKDATV